MASPGTENTCGLTAAKGTRTILVSAPGYESVELELDVDGHTKQNITLIPEPSLMLALIGGILMLRKYRG